MTIEHITNHVERARERLRSIYEDKPRVIAIQEVMAREIQDIENALQTFNGILDLANLSGVLLDFYGARVGIRRTEVSPQSDDNYRTAIELRIAVNNSKGQESIVQRYTKSVTDSTVIFNNEKFPKGILLYVDGNTKDPSLITKLKQVVSAGTSVRVVRIIVGNAFEAGSTEAVSTDDYDTGFGTLTDPDVGGSISTLYGETN